MNTMLSHWMPAAFSAVVSLLALGMQINSDSWAWKPAFFCFLPMCFVFVSSITVQMQREIRDLRKQLGDLQNQK